MASRYVFSCFNSARILQERHTPHMIIPLIWYRSLRSSEKIPHCGPKCCYSQVSYTNYLQFYYFWLLFTLANVLSDVLLTYDLYRLILRCDKQIYKKIRSKIQHILVKKSRSYRNLRANQKPSFDYSKHTLPFIMRLFTRHVFKYLDLLVFV